MTGIKLVKKEENFKICHTKLSPEQSPERYRVQGKPAYVEPFL